MKKINMNNMERIEFSTGDLIIDDNAIRFKPIHVRFSDQTVIQRVNIGDVELQDFRMYRHDDFVYITRTFLFGALLYIVTVVASFLKFDNIIFGLIEFFTYAVILLFVTLFFGFFLNAFLGVNINHSILLRVFGKNYTLVKVQNIDGGNDLIFIISDDENSELPELQNYKKNKIINVKSISNSNHLDDIIKLGQLKEKGLLSEDEFNEQKKSLLNK